MCEGGKGLTPERDWKNPMSDCTDFTLIRHGETLENLAGILQGQGIGRLSENGLRQARCAAMRLADEHFDRIYSSDLPRAMETAGVIGRQLGMDPIPFPALREWNLGDLQGRPCEENFRKYPEIMNSFQYEPEQDIPVPGGESRAEFYARVSDALEELLHRHPGCRLLLITHGGAMRAIFRHVTGPIRPGAMIPATANASYSRFCNRDGIWQLRCWNDTSHLKTVSVRESVTF